MKRIKIKLLLGSSLLGMTFLIACPPYYYIAQYANHENAVGFLFTPTILTMNGERAIGALMPGGLMRLYSNLGTSDSHLEVCNNPSSATCICNPATGTGYVRVDVDPALTASLIRNNYIIYRPSIGDFTIRSKPAAWEPGTELTQFPVYNLTVFATTNAGSGAVHSLRLRSHHPACSVDIPSIRIVDANGAEVYRIIRPGRVFYVRQGDPGVTGDFPAVGREPFSPTIPPTINGVPMDLVRPGTTVVTGTGPVEVTVSRELGILQAGFYQDMDMDGLYESGPVVASPVAVILNSDGTYTYTLTTPDLQKGQPGVYVPTMFVVLLNIEENPQKFNRIIPARYQAGTQDMHGNLLCDFRDLTADVGGPLVCTNCSWYYGLPPGGPADIGGCSLAALTGRDEYAKVLPYFFLYDPPPTGNPPPPPPPGTSPTVVELEIKPEVFHINTGVFTAFITFEDDERFNGAGADVATCNCNGANAFKIINDAENHHYSICKFRRSDIVYDMKTDFVCTGTTTTGIEWIGTDDIKEIREEEEED